MPKLYLGEQLGRAMAQYINSSEEVKMACADVSVAAMLTKMASKLGAEMSDVEKPAFGSSFVKYAESHDTEVATQFAESMDKISEAIKEGRVTSLDENLRNLFTDSDDDESMASSVSARSALETAQGFPEG